MKRIVLASGNPHKIEEIRAIFAAVRKPGDPAIELVGLDAFASRGKIPEPIEDQHTFESNALLKARYYAAKTGVTCIADDSGLEVDALDGAPGVISSHYAGVTGPRSVVDPANNKLLLRNLTGVPAEKRTARFACVMALVDPPAAPNTIGGHVDAGRPSLRGDAVTSDAPPLAMVRGGVEGRILLPEETADPTNAHVGRGSHGFGYDPLFLITSLGKTTAELAPNEKNAISHRGDAARKMWDCLRRLYR